MHTNDILKVNSEESMVLIKGSSMFPYLRTGDILIMKRTPMQHLKVGDIVAFDSHSKKDYIVHRLLGIEIKGDGFILHTKGDNNVCYDREVNDKEYAGKGIRIIRGNRTIHLEGKGQIVFSKIYSLLSFLNINHYALRSSLIIRWIRNSKVLSSIFSFPSKKLRITSFRLHHSDWNMLKGFCGNRIAASAIIHETENELIIKNWTMRYPFYNTIALSQFFDKAIKMAIENGKDSFKIEKYDRGMQVKDQILSLNIPGHSLSLIDNNLIINIKEIT